MVSGFGCRVSENRGQMTEDRQVFLPPPQDTTSRVKLHFIYLSQRRKARKGKDLKY